jgi:hypothetical protein
MTAARAATPCAGALVMIDRRKTPELGEPAAAPAR